MDNTKLIELLQNLIKQNKKNQEINFNKNVGLSGKAIATEHGKIKDAYYKGKIQAYTFILEQLEKEGNI